MTNLHSCNNVEGSRAGLTAGCTSFVFIFILLFSSSLFLSSSVSVSISFLAFSFLFLLFLFVSICMIVVRSCRFTVKDPEGNGIALCFWPNESSLRDM